MNFKKANIIIITLFITIIVGILGLITTKYVLNLINTSSENKKYYKSYYIAYGGLELELLKNKNHGYGFEDVISSGSETVFKNFTGNNYKFSANIYSMSKNITNNYKSLINSSIDCTNPNNWIEIATGDGLMMPLYYDKNSLGEGKIGTGNINYNSIDISNAVLHYDGNIVVVFNKKKNIEEDIGGENKFTRNGNGNASIMNELLNMNGLGDLSYTADELPFLVVGGIEKSKICIENNPDKMVSPYTYIVSKGTYMDRSVVVKVVKYNKWAAFSIFGLY